MTKYLIQTNKTGTRHIEVDEHNLETLKKSGGNAIIGLRPAEGPASSAVGRRYDNRLFNSDSLIPVIRGRNRI